MHNANALSSISLNIASNRHLRRKQVAEKLNTSLGVIDQWIANNSGPPFYYIGRIPLFPEDALEAWARAQMGKK